METAPLKSFATWARTALIREVSARISVVLASEELRQEQPNAVAALEKAVNAAGGSDKGRDTVADKVAYTWFNRIIALRFMDANGYTGIGVVSPERSRRGGQPEILAEAKRGNIDSAVVTNKRTAETVTSLLNGTRRSADPQGEAYALMLAEYCRYWNRSMPFMFEREGDYTELLIPANLLADDSVLARATSLLTEDICQDVEVIGWLYQFYISERKEEVFAGFKKNERAGAAEIPAATQLFTPHWIVRYLVENSLGRLWLLNKPSSRLIDQMDYYIAPVDGETDFLEVSSPEELKVIDPACGSGHMLTYAFDLLYAIYEEEGYAPSDIPGLILANNLYGTEIDPRAGGLAAFALTMKARARQRTFFNKGIEPNICVLEPISFTRTELTTLITSNGNRHDEETFWNQFENADTFGSLIRPREDLIESLRRHLSANLPEDGDLLTTELANRAHSIITQAEYLSQRYNVVVANPPYMGAKNLSPRVAEWLKSEYADGSADLFAASFYRYLYLAVDRGQLGLMSPYVWMFISTYKELRERLLGQETITSLVQLEYSGFEGATVPICAFTLQRGHQQQYPGGYVRLNDFVGPSQQGPRCLEIIQAGNAKGSTNTQERTAMANHFYRASAEDFRNIPGSPIVYWVEPQLIALYAGSLIGDRFQIKAGVGTRNDDLFMRLHWEVSAERIGRDKRWVLTDKAGEFRKWYAGFTYVMDWEDDGFRIKNYRNPDGSLKSRPQNIQFMFEEGVTWGKIGSGATSFRWRPKGYGFNDAAPAIFGPGAFDLLAQLNSNVGKCLVEIKGSTLNVQTGMVADLPIVQTSPDATESARTLTSRAVSLSKRDWDSQEISPDFLAPEHVLKRMPDHPLENVHQRVSEVQRQWVDELTQIESDIECAIRDAANLPSESTEIGPVSLLANPAFRYGRRKADDLIVAQKRDAMNDLISYAVGCMFGRYSLDEPGLILANQGDTLQDYLAKVPNPTFTPDKDNVIPIVDGDWFEDDIVARFRQFLRTAFGDQHFARNLRFVTESLGVKDLRDYFVKSFYKDHVQRYKKRPIYWLFSSSKGSFNALIYMHRYTPSTASTVLNEYLREFKAKLDASRQHQERLAAGTGAPREQAAAQKEVDRLRKVLLELDEYEHDVLYPLASQQVQIDLDDGVKANYPKLGAALKKIPGLEADS
ncbi:BREX-1 system adenine-specific DNA-methyltransferase PglX [Arthrobacter sp. OAP107]|uniref:BREX-1 system adenine-specific DNA-methyltransferase PglX n=1 Tax=Arthrobacter sp. OAP107 TaxID=3156445 RepID=UPI0033914F2A